MKSERKGHTYHYFYCSKKCGAPTVKMPDADAAAIKYLRTLLSPENQERISKALREYKGGERERIEDFNTILKQKIEEKQRRYDALLSNCPLPEKIDRKKLAKTERISGLLPDAQAAFCRFSFCS